MSFIDIHKIQLDVAPSSDKVKKFLKSTTTAVAHSVCKLNFKLINAFHIEMLSKHRFQIFIVAASYLVR